ncbi:MAG: hypothetical protein ACTSQY_08250 [Candidatus Odinarchaeia archaeon]
MATSISSSYPLCLPSTISIYTPIMELTSSVQAALNAIKVIQDEVTQNKDRILLKVDEANVMAAIAITQENIGITAKKVAIAGDTVFLDDWIAPTSLTNIRGGAIRTQLIYSWCSKNWINLDADMDADPSTHFLHCGSSIDSINAAQFYVRADGVMRAIGAAFMSSEFDQDNPGSYSGISIISSSNASLDGIMGWRNGTKTFHLDLDGNLTLGNTTASHLTWVSTLEELTLNCQGTTDTGGLIVGDIPSGTGYHINSFGVRGFRNGNLISFTALNTMVWRGSYIRPGDAGFGDSDGGVNHFVWFHADDGTLDIRGNINADDITAGTITGRTLRTAASGKRFQVDAADNYAKWYDSNGNEKARIGVSSLGGVYTLATFGNYTAGNTLSAVAGYSYSGVAIRGRSYDGEAGTFWGATGDYAVTVVTTYGVGLYSRSIAEKGAVLYSRDGEGAYISSTNTIGLVVAGDTYGMATDDGLYVGDGSNIIMGTAANTFNLHVWDGAAWQAYPAYID